jgi:hypothetical protein
MPVGPTTLLGAIPAIVSSDAVPPDTADASAAKTPARTQVQPQNIRTSEKTRIRALKPMLASYQIHQQSEIARCVGLPSSVGPGPQARHLQ